MVSELEAALAKLSDKSWRMNHLYKIKTKQRGLITYKRKLAQSNYAMRKAFRNIILKARQLGFSTEGLLDILDDTINTPNTNSAIVAHERDKVIKLFEMVKRAFDSMPEELKPKVSFDNRNELYFPELDSKIYVTLDTRSETVHNLHWSEVAFTKDADNKAAAIFAAVPKDGKITLESTANGMGGYYYEEWADEKSEFKKHFYNWLWDPDYFEPTTADLSELYGEYRGLATRYNLIPDIYERFNLSKEQFNFYIKQVHRNKHLVVQEFPTTAVEAFLAAGRNVFSVVDLQKHQTLNPIDRKWQDVLIWEKPLKGFRYVIGVDPAEGLGGDNSVITVFNADTGEQAAEYASNHMPPGDLGLLAIELGNMYNKALIVVERNNHGHATLQAMRNKYWNIYRSVVIDKVTDEKKEALGWQSNLASKPRLVDNLEEAVRTMSITVRSEELIKEMRVFVQTDEPGKRGFGAEGSAKDDRVIAAGLCVQALKSLGKAKRTISLAETKLKEYAARHGLPTVLQQEDTPFPPDQRPSSVISRNNRPNSGIKKTVGTL